MDGYWERDQIGQYLALMLQYNNNLIPIARSIPAAKHADPKALCSETSSLRLSPLSLILIHVGIDFLDSKIAFSSYYCLQCTLIRYNNPYY